MSDTVPPPGFNLVIKLNREVAQNALWICLAGIILGLAIGKFATLGGGFLVKLLGFIVSLLITGASFIVGQYLWRLTNASRNRLEFNETGMYDFISLLELGHVPMRSIAHVGFANLLGLECLRVCFFSSMNPIKKREGLLTELYRQLFGVELWVPTALFRSSRVDLESQLIHLNVLLKRKKTASPVTIAVVEPKVGLEPKIETAPIRANKPGLVGRTARLEETIPPLISEQINLQTDDKSKDRVHEQVKQIKDQVRQDGFDRKLALFYVDQVSHFQQMAASGNLPEQVSDVTMNRQRDDYEEVRFVYAAQHFCFGLRRDIGSSDEALLSVGVNGPVHLSLKVRVEIGELMPLDLESFIPGEWRLNLEQLMHLLEERNAVKMDMTVRLSPSHDVASANVQDLKDRFGIKE